MRIFKNTDGEVRNGWWVVIYFLILSVFVFALIFSADRFHFEVSIWHQLAIILMVSALCQRIRQRPFFEITGPIDRQWSQDVIAGLIIGTGLMLLPALFLTLFGMIEWKLNDVGMISLANSIITMLGVALAEEFLFRGFIFQRLLQAVGNWPAQILIGGLFLLTHLNNPGMDGVSKIIGSTNIFIASLLFGISFIKTNRLAMPIAMHFMANVVQGPILGFGVSGNQSHSMLTPVFRDDNTLITGGKFGLEASAVGLLTLVAVTVWCTQKKTNYKEPSKRTP